MFWFLFCCWSYTGIAALSKGKQQLHQRREDLDPEHFLQTKAKFSSFLSTKEQGIIILLPAKQSKINILPWVISLSFLLS